MNPHSAPSGAEPRRTAAQLKVQTMSDIEARLAEIERKLAEIAKSVTFDVVNVKNPDGKMVLATRTFETLWRGDADWRNAVQN